MAQDPRNRAEEREAVRTTIVGGRPPGCGTSVPAIPRGVEVLVRKAAIDAAFKRTLIDKRDAAAVEIGLKLQPAEAAMLRIVPAAQLAAIIDHTQVRPEHRPAFLGKAAAIMLAALGVIQAGCDQGNTQSAGIRPEDMPDGGKGPVPVASATQPTTQPAAQPVVQFGIRPDSAMQSSRGLMADRPVMVAGAVAQDPSQLQPFAQAPGGARPDRPRQLDSQPASRPSERVAGATAAPASEPAADLQDNPQMPMVVIGAVVHPARTQIVNGIRIERPPATQPAVIEERPQMTVSAGILVLPNRSPAAPSTAPTTQPDKEK